MVKHHTIIGVVVVALAVTSIAHASPPDDDVDYETETEPNPAFNMFGFRFSVGALPLDGQRATVLSVGLGVEHPVFKKTRVFGEYEWLWTTWLDERGMDSVVIRPERRGTGHRVSLGLRRELVAKNIGRSVRMFIDGELGGGVALVNDNMHGVAFVPSGLAGLRFGYDMYSSVDDSPSRTFEIELLMRAVAIDHGIGGMMGIGLLWGN